VEGQFSVVRVAVTGRQKTKKIAAYLSYMFSLRMGRHAGGPGADFKLGLAIVKPNLPSAHYAEGKHFMRYTNV